MIFKYSGVQIPSQGFASVPLIIFASKNISVSPYTLLLSANSSFPTARFIGANVPNSVLQGKSLPDFLTPKEEIPHNRTVLIVTMQEALSHIDRISEFWDKLGLLISFVYGIAAGLSPWIFSKVKNKLKRYKRLLSTIKSV